MLARSKKHKNIHVHFWSTLSWTTSWCLISLPVVLPCRMAASLRLPLSGWTRIDQAQCSSMAFRSNAPLGPVAMFTPTWLPLRSPPIAAWIVPMNSIRASHALDLALEIGFWLQGRGGGFSKSMLSQYGQEKYDQHNDDLSSPHLKCALTSNQSSLWAWTHFVPPEVPWPHFPKQAVLPLPWLHLLRWA